MGAQSTRAPVTGIARRIGGLLTHRFEKPGHRNRVRCHRLPGRRQAEATTISVFPWFRLSPQRPMAPLRMATAIAVSDEGLSLGLRLRSLTELPKMRFQSPSTNPLLIARSWSLKIAMAVFMRR